MNDPEVGRRLRRNDPTVTCLSVSYYGPSQQNTRYGAALQGNTVVNEIILNLHDYTGNNEDFDLLLNWIQASASLRKVTLFNCRSNQLIRRFLQALANNAVVDEVELDQISALDAESFASFLRSERTKFKLTLHSVEFNPAAGDRAVREVQDALHGNSSLHSLSIRDSTYQVCTTILPALSSCLMITEVDFRPRWTTREQAIQAMEEFLRSPPATLEHLILGFLTVNDPAFGRILQQLGQNNSVTKMKFYDCSFNEAATNQFKNMFQSNTGIQTLVLEDPIKFCGPNDTADTATLLTAFISENTTLKEVDVAFSGASEEPERLRPSVIINSLESNSTIERLNCGGLDNEDLSALVNSLPNYKGVKELKFRLDGTYQVPKEDVLRAFARNGSLTRVRIEQVGGTNYFTAADLRKIHFYTLRNEHAPGTLAASIDEVPVSLRPRIYEALGESRSAPTLILRDLKRLGDKVGLSDSRKRSAPST